MTDAPTTPPPPPLRQISAARAIALVRRWLRVAAGFHVAMALAVGGATTRALASEAGLPLIGGAVLFWLATVFFVVGLSIRSRRFAIDAAPLIAAGEFGVAEDRLSQSLTSFSVLRSSKLLGLGQLARLRHAQSRWAEAASLSRELLARHRGRREEGLETPSRLLLAESLVELGDLDAAAEQVATLDAGEPLDLRETLMLATIRLELLARRDRAAEMLAELPATLALVELLPPSTVASPHALLAWAAWRLGREDDRAMLSNRVRLLGDVDAIVARRPFLGDALA
jgi:hypothetical protein